MTTNNPRPSAPSVPGERVPGTPSGSIRRCMYCKEVVDPSRPGEHGAKCSYFNPGAPPTGVPPEHAGRTEKYWQPGLGPCQCDDCKRLPMNAPTGVPPEQVSEHELKIWPEHFENVQSGRKTFEFRLDDRGFLEGDILRLREYDPRTREYTGRELSRRVTYILHLMPDQPGHPPPCVLALAPVSPSVPTLGECKQSLIRYGDDPVERNYTATISLFTRLLSALSASEERVRELEGEREKLRGLIDDNLELIEGAADELDDALLTEEEAAAGNTMATAADLRRLAAALRPSVPTPTEESKDG